MSLSEIAKNTAEYPGPQKEWEKCKKLVDTIIKSGAMRLMENLYHSIGSNPTLTYQVEEYGKIEYFLLKLHRDLIVMDANGIRKLAKLEPHPAGKFDLDGPESWMQHTPYASISLSYNAREMYISTEGSYRFAGYPHPPFVKIYDPGETRKVRYFDTLVVECNDPGTLIISSDTSSSEYWSFRNKYMKGESVTNPTTSEGIKMVDKILGDLYSKHPAKTPTIKPIFWGIPPIQ